MRATIGPELTGSYAFATGLRRAKGSGVSIRVASTGDDNNDGLTIPTAVQTLARAEQLCPVDPDSACTITLQDAATFTAPSAMLLSNTTITGATATRVTQIRARITALTLVAEDDGIRLTVVDDSTGLSPGWTANQYAGRHVQFASDTPTVALRNGWFAIVANGADTIDLVPDKDLSWAVASSMAAGAEGVGDEFNVVRFDAVIDITSLLLLRACARLTITGVRITGASLEIGSPNGVTFDRVQFDNTDTRQKGGTMELDNCSFAFTGSDSTPIELDCLSALTLYGCAIRGHGGAGSAILARCNSTISWRAKNALADFPVGVAFRPGWSSVIRTQSGDQGARIWLRDSPGSVGEFAWNDGEGALGGGDLPRIGGTSSGTYTVQAENSARVQWDSGSTVTDGTGTATVSATGGSTNVGEAGDGTRIQGGSPAALSFTYA